MAKLPSKKQLGYLKGLGYSGAQPASSKQASVAIDAMLETRDAKAAERAVIKQQKEEGKREKQTHRDQLQAIKEEIRFMVKENRAYGGNGLFAGFRFVEIEDERSSEDDKPYIDAFVPLEVAHQYPELLQRKTIDYEEVLSDDKLPRGTRVVMAPGRFKALGSRFGCLGVLLVILAVAVALIQRA